MKQTVRPIQLSADELQAIYNDLHKQREEGEFTLAEFMAANPDLNKTQASNFLCHGVDNGTLTKRMDVYIDGRFRTVYKRAEKKV
jgi:hypothetical protein